MGGAQPLAVTMNGGVALVVEVDPSRIEKRLTTRYLDESTADVDDALERARRYATDGVRALDWRCSATPRTSCRRWSRAASRPTSSPIRPRRTIRWSATCPTACHSPTRRGCAPPNPADYQRRSIEAMGRHVAAMREMQKRGAIAFDYGNNIRAQAVKAGVTDAFEIPGFVPEYIRPLFCEGKGPFRWVALSGDPEDIRVTDRAVLEMFPNDASLTRWIALAGERVQFQGLPARICWLGYGDRAKFGLRLNQLVRDGAVKAPIVIGRDHLDTGSVASPNRETEGMRDGSDAIADWPILNALLNASAGATWVSLHHGGGVGIGYSIHAGMVIVADGTREADERLARVLTCDPGTGVVRHADAGYPEALEHRTSTRSTDPHAGDEPMMAPHAGLERRVLAALDATPARIPVVIGGCGTGRTTLLHALADRMGREQCQYIDVERAASTPERFHQAVAAASPFTVNGQSAARGGSRAVGARRVRSHAGADDPRPRRPTRRPRRSCSTKSSSCARSKASPACATCCARCCTRWPRAAIASC